MRCLPKWAHLQNYQTQNWIKQNSNSELLSRTKNSLVRIARAADNTRLTRKNIVLLSFDSSVDFCMTRI